MPDDCGCRWARKRVLVGHVTSRNLGNVFEDLRSVRVGDDIQVF